MNIFNLQKCVRSTYEHATHCDGHKKVSVSLSFARVCAVFFQTTALWTAFHHTGAISVGRKSPIFFFAKNPLELMMSSRDYKRKRSESEEGSIENRLDERGFRPKYNSENTDDPDERRIVDSDCRRNSSDRDDKRRHRKHRKVFSHETSWICGLIFHL